MYNCRSKRKDRTKDLSFELVVKIIRYPKMTPKNIGEIMWMANSGSINKPRIIAQKSLMELVNA
jgi:hypothetical protein